MEIKQYQESLKKLCEAHFIKRLTLFGSATGEDFHNASDIDFLYEVDTERFEHWSTGKYDYIDNLMSFENSLRQLFNRQIDLIPDIPIRNRIFEQSINTTKQLVYAA